MKQKRSSLSKISKIKEILIEKNIINNKELNEFYNKEEFIQYMNKTHHEDIISEILNLVGYKVFTDRLTYGREQATIHNHSYWLTHKNEIKKYREEHKEEISEYNKEYSKMYYQENKEQMSQQKKEHYQENKEEILQRCKDYHIENRETILSQQSRKRKQIRLQVLSHYSPELKCKCCGENHYEFLTIDHINNDGAEHRKEIGGNLYEWLISNNFPEGFQVLCYNCNMCKGHYPNCYHQNNNIQPKSKYKERDRFTVLSHYSQGEPKCACCGENIIFFLSLDHINGKGNEHRRELNKSKNYKATNNVVYRWIIENNFPVGFQVLCHNCNSSLGRYNYCPHDFLKIYNKSNNKANWLIYLPFKESDAIVKIGLKQITSNLINKTINPLNLIKIPIINEEQNYMELFA